MCFNAFINMHNLSYAYNPIIRMQEDIDRELELNQRNLFEKWKGKMGFYYLYLISKDY